MPNPSVSFFETQKETAILRTKHESAFLEHFDNCKKLINVTTNTLGNMNNEKSLYVFLALKGNTNNLFNAVNKQLSEANKSLGFMQIFTDKDNAVDMQLLKQHEQNFAMIKAQVENLAKQSASNAPAPVELNTQFRSKL